MSEPDGSKQCVNAAIIAIPIMIACCAAPVFTFGLASAVFGSFSGIGSMEIIGLLELCGTSLRGTQVKSVNGNQCDGGN